MASNPSTTMLLGEVKEATGFKRELVPGSRALSVLQLAQQYVVALTTERKTVDLLKADSLAARSR